MRHYRVVVRIELIDDFTDRLVTYDDHVHYFDAIRATGAHEDYQTIDDAVFAAIEQLEDRSPQATDVRNEAKEK